MSERAQAVPQGVLTYLQPLLLRSRHLAYLRTDGNGLVVEQGGDFAHYGIAALQLGQPASSQIALLAGLIPHEGSPLCLQAVHTDEGTCADLHIFVENDGTWVLLIDTTNEHDQKQAMQQKGNELSLRNERQGLMLDAYLGKSVAASLLAGRWQRAGERREITVLFADIRGFTPYSEEHTPEEVFRTLNQYLPAMINPIEDHRGLIEHIAGDAVMGMFGIIDSSLESASLQAVLAGLHVQRAVRTLNQQRRAHDQTCLAVGIGIASGPAAVGVVGTHDRRGFAAIGHHVNMASRLQGQARAGEVVVDETTHALWQRAHQRGALPREFAEVVFEERRAALKGFRDVLRAFVTYEQTASSSHQTG